MGSPTVVLFGTAQHATLTTLYHYLVERGQRRVVYLSNEVYPNEPGFDYELSQEFEDGRFLIENQDPVEFGDIVSVGLDGFYVHPPDLAAYSPKDQEYLQSESWAALIAIFAGLSRNCLVANHVTRREDLNSRIAMLSLLAHHGLTVPDVRVTSNPEVAREFIQRHGGKVFHRPIAVRELALNEWTAEDEERLDRIRLCPVHFEQQLSGRLVSATKIGDEIFGDKGITDLPLEQISQACKSLDLHLAELSFRETPGGWVCTSLYPFLRSHQFAQVTRSEQIAQFFEEGLPA
jgi:hypothetical protein